MSKDITAPELLAAALPHIPFDGWTEQSFKRACDDLNVEYGWFTLLFPEGPKQTLELYFKQLNTAMEIELRAMPLKQMKIREKVTAGVMSVFKHAEAHKEAVHKAAVFLALPQHAPLAASCLYQTVDSIWYAIGDSSTDFNFYTKRATLAGVFSSTLLVWLEDETTDLAPTRTFLDRRIADVMQFEKAKAQFKKWLPKWKTA